MVVVGFGASGLAAARLCLAKGARSVVMNDRREAADLGEDRVLQLVREGARMELGHHEPSAFERADLVVLSPGVPRIPAVEALEATGVPVVGELEMASWYVRAPIVGITGTNGKSTVTTLLGNILRRAGFPTFVGGNLGEPLSLAVDTPAAEEGGRLVVELSSYQLEKTDYFHPHGAVWLNLTPDHLDRYPSFAAYGAAKARIFLRQTREDFAVVPGDDPVVLAFARAGAAPVSTYGAEGSPVRIHGEAIVAPGGARYPLDLLKIRGTHNVDNAMAAVLAAHLAGARPEPTYAELAAFEGLPHRMQLVLEDRGVVYYDDSKATNVGAAVRALEGVDRPVVLIAGGRDKGGSYEPLVRLLRVKARAVVLLGEAAPLLRAALGGQCPHHDAEDMFDAVRLARALARPGDAVLLAPACSSLDMFDDYRERGRVFAAAVRNLTGEGGAP
ncbi:MAG: UDP-N-acetylmuramoyl-L-alanine--D-glutamate ligase [Deltaproteobacteria bacterium]|nr:UDP-N-acetylmuramoyl-L-alanine--D-glutamate ligase [Deltaproteobacteria bacterium]